MTALVVFLCIVVCGYLAYILATAIRDDVRLRRRRREPPGSA